METAGLVLTLIGLVVAVVATPTILQMIFGRPSFSFRADEFTGDEGKILLIAIMNEPVTSKFLKAMKVERDAGEIISQIDITELGTNKVIAVGIRGLLGCVATTQQGTAVNARPGFTVGLQIIATRNGTAGIIDGSAPEILRPLNSGHYIANIIIFRGQQSYQMRQVFQVGDADYKTTWATSGVVLVS